MPHLFNSLTLCFMGCVTFFQRHPPPTGEAILAIAFFALALWSAFLWALQPKPEPVDWERLKGMQRQLVERWFDRSLKPHGK